TAPFAVAVIPPEKPEMDPTAIVSFTNFVEPPGCFTDDDPMSKDMPCATAAHITVTANGAPTPFNVASNDGTTFTVTPSKPPMGGPCPAGATIVVTIDAVPVNLLGQTLTAGATGMFTAAP